MKKILCSVIIAVSAMNAPAVYAQTGDVLSSGGFSAVIPVNHADGAEYEYAPVFIAATPGYELENTEGTAQLMEEKEKEQVLTRDMLMETLYALEGGPGVAVSKIIGVPYFNSDSEQAATWAYENKIMYGYGDNKFGNGDYATREQLAAMLFRYASDGRVPNLALTFDDADEISDWAADSIRWAVSAGIMDADESGKFEPLAPATVYDMNNALRILGKK